MSIKYFIVSVALLSFCAAGLRAQEFALSTNFADYAEFGTLITWRRLMEWPDIGASAQR